MQVFNLPFGEWLPDQPDFKNQGLVLACNVYPGPGGYTPMAGAVVTSETTTESVNGAQNFFDNASQPVVVASSSTRLIVKRGSTVTETSGFTAVSDAWRFERFKDLIVAVSAENDPQYLTDIDSDDTWSALPGAPPKAAQIGRVGDFLVMGDLTDIDGLGNPVVPNRVRWSAFNNPTTSWVTDRGELSDYRDLDVRYGRVTAIVGGRFGLIFQERAVWRMVFVGAPKVFEFEPVLIGQGCVAGDSAVTIGSETFFYSQNGFLVTDGSGYSDIGAERVNDWMGNTASDTDARLTHGTVNWPKRSIVWGFRPTGAQRFTRQIIYNFVTKRWSCGTQEVDYLVRYKVAGKTLADLTVDFPGGLGDMSAYTLGTSEWKAKNLTFAAFMPSGSGSVFATLDGAAVEAEFVTADDQLEPGYRSFISGVWPSIETQDATIKCQVRSRLRQGGDVSVSPQSETAADGFCPFNQDGWLHSIRTVISAGGSWDKAQGLQVRAVRTGRR